jgi:hypothetical protein
VSRRLLRGHHPSPERWRIVKSAMGEHDDSSLDRIDEVDVLIVGARVAGSILATSLRQAGWSVLVVDRATFPSATISTHFFRGAWCVTALDRVGVLPEVLATGAPPLVREYNADALDGSWSIDPPQDPGEIGYCLAVRRETLDAILVRRARKEPGVTVLEGVALREAWSTTTASSGPRSPPMRTLGRSRRGSSPGATATHRGSPSRLAPRRKS